MTVSEIVNINSRALLKHALGYAKLGWHVFPCWWIENGQCACGKQCASPGKHPIPAAAPRGQDNATDNIEQIKAWWRKFPKANIAIHARRSGLVAIDIDPRNGGWETLAAIEDKYGPLFSDVYAETGGDGEHRYLLLDANYVGRLPGKLGPGVDIKREGYIIAPSSNHASGKTYEWEASSDPLEGCIPSPMPEWLRDISMTPAAAPIEQPAHPLDEQQVLEIRSALNYIDADDYHQWIEIGMALHSTGAGQQAYGLWTEWSQASAKFNPKNQAYKWRSFGNGKHNTIGLATLFQRAQGNGWVNIASNTAQEYEEKYGAAIEAANRGGPLYTLKPDAPIAIQPFPIAILNDIAAWMEQQAPVTHPAATQQAVLMEETAVNEPEFQQLLSRSQFAAEVLGYTQERE